MEPLNYSNGNALTVPILQKQVVALLQLQLEDAGKPQLQNQSQFQKTLVERSMFTTTMTMTTIMIMPIPNQNQNLKVLYPRASCIPWIAVTLLLLQPLVMERTWSLPRFSQYSFKF